jgi:hypothetical protein
MRGSPWSAEEMKSLGRRRPAEVQAVSQTGTTATPRLSACKSICQLERAGEEGRGTSKAVGSSGGGPSDGEGTWTESLAAWKSEDDRADMMLRT